MGSPKPFRPSAGAFSKKPSFVGKLKQLRFSVGKTQHFSVGNIKTKSNFL